MSRRSWQTVIVAGFTAFGLTAATGRCALAQEYGVASLASDAECFDECADECDEGCESGCCCTRLSLCNKLRLHCAYYRRRCQRPYIRLNAPPPSIAPYVGPGMWNSPGYGMPAGHQGGGAYCPQPSGPMGGPYGYSHLGPAASMRPQGGVGPGYRPAAPQTLPAGYVR
ncbi:MAG: hypothetical protein EXS05_04370 [Planctomycetaceae bacterium]|nr:hypothetical protein [Planctomycetaceae bacterium]